MVIGLFWHGYRALLTFDMVIGLFWHGYRIHLHSIWVPMNNISLCQVRSRHVSSSLYEEEDTSPLNLGTTELHTLSHRTTHTLSLLRIFCVCVSSCVSITISRKNFLKRQGIMSLKWLILPHWKDSIWCIVTCIYNIIHAYISIQCLLTSVTSSYVFSI